MTNGNQGNDINIDIAVLKINFNNILKIFETMESSIRKIIEQQEKIISQIYDDMKNHKEESKDQIKELNLKIDNITKDFHDRLEDSENKIMKEISNIRDDLNKSKTLIDSLNEYKWLLMGAIGLLSWIIYNIPFLDILNTLKK